MTDQSLNALEPEDRRIFALGEGLGNLLCDRVTRDVNLWDIKELDIDLGTAFALFEDTL